MRSEIVNQQINEGFEELFESRKPTKHEKGNEKKDLRPFKDWLYTVLSVTFLVAALYQSLVFTLKFISKPTTTSYDFERSETLELPSFTICANPAFHFNNLEKIADNYGASIPKFLSSFPFMQFRYSVAHLERMNMTLLEFLRKTGASLGLTATTCYLANQKNLSCSPTYGMNRFEDIEQSFKILRPTPIGVWEMRIVHLLDSYTLCDTFTANVSIAPGTESGLEINLMTRPKGFYLSYPGNHSDWLKRVHLLGIPHWGLYIHAKDEPKITYERLEKTEKIVIRPFTRTEVGLAVKKFNFLPSGSRPCKEDANYSYVQCEEQCVESKLLPCILLPRKTSCLIQKNCPAAANGSSPGDRECQVTDYDEYTTSVITTLKRKATVALTSSCCPVKCSEVQYDYRVVIAEDISQRMADNFDLSELNKPTKAFIATAVLYWRTSNVEIIQHEYSYSFTQYLGELGGTWGLFLGVSIISVLHFIEHLFKALFGNGEEKELAL